MTRVTSLILALTLATGCATLTSAQEEIAPGQAIGKRVELVVSSKIEGGEFICEGEVVLVDQKKLVLEEVTKTETTINGVPASLTGIPFLTNPNNAEKLFTNVGVNKKIELEFGIVLSLDRIKSCRIASEAAAPTKTRLHPWFRTGFNRTGLDLPQSTR